MTAGAPGAKSAGTPVGPRYVSNGHRSRTEDAVLGQHASLSGDSVDGKVEPLDFALSTKKSPLKLEQRRPDRPRNEALITNSVEGQENGVVTSTWDVSGYCLTTLTIV